MNYSDAHSQLANPNERILQQRVVVQNVRLSGIQIAQEPKQANHLHTGNQQRAVPRIANTLTT